MAKPYVILAHYRTGSKMIQSMLEDNGIVDAYAKYGEEKYNLDNICADIYYNNFSKRRITRSDFDLKIWLSWFEDAVRYYQACAEKDKLMAYSIRINHAIQKPVFDLVFPILKKKKNLFHPTYITMCRDLLDVVYSIHRVKKKIESTGAKMNPELSDVDVVESFMSSLPSMGTLIKSYDTAYFMYPNEFLGKGMVKAKGTLTKLGCESGSVKKIFKNTKVTKMPPEYDTPEGECYREKYKKEISIVHEFFQSVGNWHRINRQWARL